MLQVLSEEKFTSELDKHLLKSGFVALNLVKSDFTDSEEQSEEFDEEENTGQSTFINYTKSLLKVFTLLSIVVLVMALKNRLLGQEATLFYTALFVVAATFLLTILSTFT